MRLYLEIGSKGNLIEGRLLVAGEQRERLLWLQENKGFLYQCSQSFRIYETACDLEACLQGSKMKSCHQSTSSLSSLLPKFLPSLDQLLGQARPLFAAA